MTAKKPSIEKALFGFDYTFKDQKLLKAALTHPSITRRASEDYERLEFLGDRVLGLVIAEYLYKKFPKDKEGVLAKKMSSLISKPPLMKVARKIGLANHLHMSDGERKTGGLEKESNLADAMEALIGALYLDAGLELAENFILTQWDPLMSTAGNYAMIDAKSTLQEIAQAKGFLPEYRLIKKEGEQHDPVFTVGVRLSSKDTLIEGVGRSKRLAEKEAARKLLLKIKKEGL